MAEQEPTVADLPVQVRGGVDKLQQKAEKAQREYEKAQTDLARQAAFGAFDVAAPNEGEGNYQEYIDSRPAAPQDGVTRNGEVFQNVATGKFAGEAAYNAQNGDADTYYRDKADQGETVSISMDAYESMKVAQLNSEVATARAEGSAARESLLEEVLVTKYAELGVMQLAKEAATAHKEGNEGREKSIREALEHHLTMDAMKDDSETPEEAQARYDSEVSRYEELVERLLERGAAKPAHAADTHLENPGEGHPSQRDTEADSTETAEDAPVEQPAPVETTDATEASAEDEKPAEVEPEVSPQPETEPEPETFPYLNGRKVTLGTAFVSPDGRRAIEVIDADGTSQVVFESQVQYLPQQKEGAAFAVGGDGTVNILDKDIKDASPKPATFAVDSKGEVEVLDEDIKAQIAGIEPDPRVEEEKREQLTGIKKWWNKAQEGFYKVAGATFWAKEWMQERKSQWLEHNIDDTMTEEEKEKRRDRNRTAMVIATAALIAIPVAAIAATTATGIANLTEGHSGGGLGGNGSGDPGEYDRWMEREQAHQDYLDSLRDNDGGSEGPTNLPIEGGAETVTVPEVDASQGQEMYITSGEGGEALFNRLGIDPAKFYANQYALVEQFPQDFRINPTGDGVWISHTGELSQGAQTYINSLR